jgi:hypothetical protein
VDLLLKSSLRITGLLSVNWTDVGPLLAHRGASQEARVGLDLGYNIRAKNLDIARTPQPSMSLKKSLRPLIAGRVSTGVQGVSRTKKILTKLCSI